MNKKLLAAVLSVLAPLFLVWGQGARESVLADPALAEGIYSLRMEPVTAGTPAPKGYKPVYISHYARHGARYLVTERHYNAVLNPLAEAAAADALTPLGRRLHEAGEAFYTACAKGRAGDLSPVGWEQHRRIAREVLAAFPALFKGAPRIEAGASVSIRSILSMQAFCLALQQVRPRVSLYAQAGRTTMPWTLPESKDDAGDFARTPMPWSVSPHEYLAGKVDAAALVARLFTDPSYVRDPLTFGIYLYNFLVSDACTPGRIGVAPLEVFTPDELYAFWEEDNLETYVRVAGNLPCYHSMLEDIVSRTEGDRQAGIPVRLRFGHDIGVDALAFMLGIDGADRLPREPDQVADIWQTWRTPMASTFLLVRYEASKGEPLFKVILNGEEVSLSKLTPVVGPYYQWADLEALTAAE